MIAITKRTVTASTAVLLAGCAIAQTSDSVDDSGGEVALSTNVVFDSLVLPGLAVADRLDSGRWPQEARLEELLRCTKLRVEAEPWTRGRAAAELRR